jgi:hypothetical protein
MEFTKTYQSHIWINLNTIVVEPWIMVKFQHAKTAWELSVFCLKENRSYLLLDGSNTFLWSSNSKLDHSGRLIRSNFEWVTLVGLDCANLHWIHGPSRSLNQGKEPVLEIDVVSLNKVIIHAHHLCGCILVGVVRIDLHREFNVLGMSTLLAKLGSPDEFGKNVVFFL